MLTSGGRIFQEQSSACAKAQGKGEFEELEGKEKRAMNLKHKGENGRK